MAEEKRMSQSSPQTLQTTPDPKRWIALVLLCAAQFMVVLDASIVNVALPSIKNDLGFSQESLQWVVSAYTLVFGGFLLLGGRMADLLGRRRMFVGGLLLFSVASLAGGFATSEGWLIAARSVQGLGAAIISPAALAIVTTTFQEGSERNKALGIWGAIAGAGGAAGVLLGGVLTDSLGWEWVLFVNFPIGIAAALAAPRFVRESKIDREARHFDALGAVSITAGLVVLVYALVKANDYGWGSVTTIALLASAAVLIAGFTWIESRSRSPLVPLRIFSVRTVTGANVIGLLVGASLFAMFYFISLYLQQVLGYSPLKTGVAYLPLALGIIVSAGIASALVERVGVKPTLISGLVLVVAGLLLFTRVDTNGAYVGDVLIPSLVVAFGLGLSFVPMTIAAVAGVSDSEAGLASGLINTSQQVGGALGLAVLSAVATSRTDSVLQAARGARDALPNALTEGFQSAFAVGALFAAVAIVLAVVLLRGRAVAVQQTPEPVGAGAEPEAA
jgi:EmrB/QacA subfamily drug resistance transporter